MPAGGRVAFDHGEEFFPSPVCFVLKKAHEHEA